MDNLIRLIAYATAAFAMFQVPAIAQTRDDQKPPATTLDDQKHQRSAASRQIRREERMQQHANQTAHNLHDQAATSHKFRHERHRVERNRIEGTPGQR
jgi:hypothetical protein